MDQLVHFYLKNALAPATKKIYQSGQRRYINYCDKAHCQPLPLTEQRLCQFVAKLAEEGLSHQTIKSYLSATRQLQLAANLPEPHIGSMSKLEQVLKGIKEVKSRSVAQAHTRLPMNYYTGYPTTYATRLGPTTARFQSHYAMGTLMPLLLLLSMMR